MILENIQITHFRAHEQSELSFSPDINLISGPNGIGKTNVLEAVHYLSLTKSFLTTSENILLNRNASHYAVNAEFRSDSGRQLRVTATYARGEGKKFFVNGAPLERRADHIGRIPTVLICPQDHALTAGGPAERRRFMDVINSQSSATYLEDLLRYRRILRQRNDLLQRSKRSGHEIDPGLIGSWTNELVSVGARITERRLTFSRLFSGLLSRAYEQLGSRVEHPTLSYLPNGGISISPNEEFSTDNESDPSVESIEGTFRAAIEANRERERERGATLIGPHRDDLVFRLDGLDVRRYASQGQHRTFALALKLAEVRFLHEKNEESPILLLDDVFDNLDADRIGLFLNLLHDDGMGQSLITAARREILEGFVDFTASDNRLIELPLASEPSSDRDSDLSRVATKAV